MTREDATFSSSVSLKLKLPIFAASSGGPSGKNSLGSFPARFRLRLGGGVVYAHTSTYLFNLVDNSMRYYDVPELVQQ